MPKDTFYNLHSEKKERVVKVLKKVFEEKPFQEVTVKEIVEELDIARGSFYQYFEDLEDAYFEILKRELVDIHGLLTTIMEKHPAHLEAALMEYGDELSKILFKSETYLIYRNSYLFWNESLAQRWARVHNDHAQALFDNDEKALEREKIHYLKGVVHMLIKRNYQENWTKEEFQLKYQQHVCWMMKGLYEW